VKPRTWYRLCLCGGVGILLTVLSGYYLDPRGPWFLGSEVSKASSALLLFWFAREFKKKIKD
jgi:hypothetical protein